MNPIILAALYALIGDVLATFLAAALAVAARGQVKHRAVGVFLGASAAFIVGAAFLDLIAEAQQRSHNDFVVAAGVALGLLLMIALEVILGTFGMGEKEEEEESKSSTREPAPASFPSEWQSITSPRPCPSAPLSSSRQRCRCWWQD